jgi:Uma2 family endonuclease
MASTGQNNVQAYLDYLPLSIYLRPVLDLSDDEVFELSRNNRDLRIERSSNGELIIMPPTGGEIGDKNAEITMQLRLWSKKDRTGKSFDSSTGFRLPNGALRSPDASWVSNAELELLTAEQKRKFLPLCPEFLVELKSSTDNLLKLQEKMEEYLNNGMKLGLLIDTDSLKIYIYRKGGVVEVQDQPDSISCEPILPGFTLDLTDIWTS